MSLKTIGISLDNTFWTLTDPRQQQKWMQKLGPQRKVLHRPIHPLLHHPLHQHLKLRQRQLHLWLHSLHHLHLSYLLRVVSEVVHLPVHQPGKVLLRPIDHLVLHRHLLHQNVQYLHQELHNGVLFLHHSYHHPISPLLHLPFLRKFHWIEMRNQLLHLEFLLEIINLRLLHPPPTANMSSTSHHHLNNLEFRSNLYSQLPRHSQVEAGHTRIPKHLPPSHKEHLVSMLHQHHHHD